MSSWCVGSISTLLLTPASRLVDPQPPPTPLSGTAPPQVPMAGRATVQDYHNQAAWDTGSVPVWRVALATLLPTIAVLLLAWQVMQQYSVKRGSSFLHTRDVIERVPSDMHGAGDGINGAVP